MRWAGPAKEGPGGFELCCRDTMEPEDMKTFATALLLGALTLPALATSATAGSVIAQACSASDRGRLAPSLCGCIQSVADSVLSPAEQVLGAQIFLEPHRSQEIRASAQATDAAFWAKWQVFGNAAAQHCQ